jgi:uncharacterized protein YjiS (DUF1127 family)
MPGAHANHAEPGVVAGRLWAHLLCIELAARPEIIMANNRFLDPIVNLFGDIGRARHAVSEYERLNRLSDGALAARGISRSDLPAMAFKAGFER